MDAQLVSNPLMNTLASRVKLARERLEITQLQVAQRAGMRQAEISKLESGSIAGSTKMVALARALQCDPYWLVTGSGEPWGQPANDALEFSGRGGNVVGLPVRGASDFLEGGVEIDASDPSTEGVVLGSGVHHGYAIRVRGDRNAPALKDGQFVVVEEAPARPGDLGLFHLADGSVVLRELLRETLDAYHVDSPAWGARQTFPKENVHDTEAIVAVVSPSRWTAIEGRDGKIST